MQKNVIRSNKKLSVLTGSVGCAVAEAGCKFSAAILMRGRRTWTTGVRGLHRILKHRGQHPARMERERERDTIEVNEKECAKENEEEHGERRGGAPVAVGWRSMYGSRYDVRERKRRREGTERERVSKFAFE